MPLQEFINSITVEELKLRLYHMYDREYKRPKLSDYLLMQISREVARKFSKDPNSIKLVDFDLSKFFREPQKYTTEELSMEEKIKRSKAATFAALGIKG